VRRIRTVLDFPTDSPPVLLKGVVPLDEGLKLVPLGRVADLHLPQHPDPSVDVRARHRGWHLLDTKEILLIERSQALESNLEIFQGFVELSGFHEVPSSRAE
jgi:hypothetical protein